MADAFCDFNDLTDFQKDLLSKIKNVFPDETKKFLKEEAAKLKKVVVSNSKSLVKKKTGNYLKGIKTGKVYKYGGALTADTCIRVYNNAHHAHLIENGHKTQNGKFISGKHILETSEKQFAPEFNKDCSDFLADFAELAAGK